MVTEIASFSVRYGQVTNSIVVLQTNQRCFACRGGGATHCWTLCRAAIVTRCYTCCSSFLPRDIPHSLSYLPTTVKLPIHYNGSITLDNGSCFDDSEWKCHVLYLKDATTPRVCLLLLLTSYCLSVWNVLHYLILIASISNKLKCIICITNFCF